MARSVGLGSIFIDLQNLMFNGRFFLKKRHRSAYGAS